VSEYRPDVLLLDDGFQHLRLGRDADILLVNATDPWGGGHLLPLGNLREPRWALKRASLVLLTHADGVGPERLEELRAEIERMSPGIPVAEAVHRPCFLLDLATESRVPLTALRKQTVTLLSAIGDPDSFAAQVRRLGATVDQQWRFP